MYYLRYVLFLFLYCITRSLFGVDVIPHQKGKSVNEQKGNKINTEYLLNQEVGRGVKANFLRPLLTP